MFRKKRAQFAALRVFRQGYARKYVGYRRLTAEMGWSLFGNYLLDSRDALAAALPRSNCRSGYGYSNCFLKAANSSWRFFICPERFSTCCSSCVIRSLELCRLVDAC